MYHNIQTNNNQAEQRNGDEYINRKNDADESIPGGKPI